MNFSNELIEKAKTASSAEELLEIAKAEGVELSAAEAETYFNFLKNGSRPLSDEELEQVAGGKGEPAPKYYVGQHLWIGYTSTSSYGEVEVLGHEFYDKSKGWSYLILRYLGNFECSCYLEDCQIVKTYKPDHWEDGPKNPWEIV